MPPTLSAAVVELLFDYADLSDAELRARCESLSPKVLRWLGAHHPDNRTRKVFFECTNVTIGEGCVVNAGFVVSDDYRPLLTLGKRVAVSPNVTVICASAPNNSLLAHVDVVRERMICAAEVFIGDDAWIGAGAIILPGVTLGRGCVVGAGAVVSRDVPDFTVVAGNPAKPTRRLPQP